MIKIDAKWEHNYSNVSDEQITFYRSDTANIEGRVWGDDVSTLTIKTTVVSVQDANSEVIAWTKDSTGSDIIISNVSQGLSFFYIKLISKGDTTNYESGTQFRFDIEFQTNEDVMTIISGFSIAKDYTLN